MAHPRHKRETNARRFVSQTGVRTAKLAIGAAAVATVPAVALGVVQATPAASIGLQAHQQPLQLDPQRYDGAPVSRSFNRTAARNFQEGVAALKRNCRHGDNAVILGLCSGSLGTQVQR